MSERAPCQAETSMRSTISLSCSVAGQHTDFTALKELFMYSSGNAIANASDLLSLMGG